MPSNFLTFAPKIFAKFNKLLTQNRDDGLVTDQYTEKRNTK